MSDDQDDTPFSPAARESTPVRTFSLDAHGLRRILGSTEADLMQALWLLASGAEDEPEGWTTIGAVCQSLGPGHHYKTVQTVMNRLVEKRLVMRRQEAPAYRYRPAVTREALITQVTRQVIDGLVLDFGHVAVVQLAQALQTVSPQYMALLEDLANEEMTADDRASSSGHGDAAEDGDEGAH
jgi:predicted transcriptional regulator